MMIWVCGNVAQSDAGGLLDLNLLVLGIVKDVDQRFYRPKSLLLVVELGVAAQVSH